MTFFVYAKDLDKENKENREILIDLKKAIRILIRHKTQVTGDFLIDGDYYVVIDYPIESKRCYAIYSAGSKNECKKTIEKLRKKLIWHERIKYIIAPGIFIFLGVFIGFIIKVC